MSTRNTYLLADIKKTTDPTILNTIYEHILVQIIKTKPQKRKDTSVNTFVA